MALSVILMEHMGDKGHAALLKEEFLRALMAGTLAGDLTPQARESEEAFLAAMFQNLGRLLTEYYFPEEALQIRQRLSGPATALAGTQAPPPPTAAAREEAARKVLGLGFDDLGAGIAKAWGLPDTLQRGLRVPEGDVPQREINRRADHGVERMRWLALGANALTDAMLGADGAEQTAALTRVAEIYGPALGLQPRDILVCAQGARARLSNMAQAMGIHVAADAPARRLLQATEPGTIDNDANTLVAGAGSAAAAQAQLTQGLDAVRQAVAQKSMRLNEVLNLVLQTMQQALGLRCVVFCLREPRTGHLVGRFALGDGSADISAAFRITPEIAGQPDLFAAICAKGADLLISDTKTVATRLPGWYRQKVNAPTFLLLPLHLKGSAIGLIYADKTPAGSLVIGDAELATLRGLRDQAVAAFGRGATQGA